MIFCLKIVYINILFIILKIIYNRFHSDKAFIIIKNFKFYYFKIPYDSLIY